MSLSPRDVIVPALQPWEVVGADAELDLRTAPAWGARLRAACRSLADERDESLVAPILLVDLRPVRLLSAAAMGEMASTREHAAAYGVEMVVLLEPGGRAHRMLGAGGLTSGIAVFGVAPGEGGAAR